MEGVRASGVRKSGRLRSEYSERRPRNKPDSQQDSQEEMIVSSRRVAWAVPERIQASGSSRRVCARKARGETPWMR
jgi:hypothetical protein